MSNRIVATICPHCKQYTSVFVMVGQTFIDACEHCKKRIYFDDVGEIYKSMTKKKLDRLIKERDEYYEKIAERYSR
jgi:hypothetical protein